jgi:hypothetical protein
VTPDHDEFDDGEPSLGYERCWDCGKSKILLEDKRCGSCLGFVEIRTPAKPLPPQAPLKYRIVGSRWPGVRAGNLKFTEFEAKVIIKRFGGRIEEVK